MSTPIVTVPAQVLRTPTKLVETIDKKILDIISRMYETLKSAKNPAGVGLAAPQIGEPYQIFLIWPDHKHDPMLFINPQIIELSQRQQSPLDTHLPKKDRGVYEGCLSIPHHYSPLSRSMSVTVTFQHFAPVTNYQLSVDNQINNLLIKKLSDQLTTDNCQLTTKTAQYSGFAAHIIQHEIDHLNGILFIDRVLQQNQKLYKVEGKTWTEISL